MSRYPLIIALAMALFTAPALAGQCPKHLKYFDDNMMKNKVSAAQMKVAMALRKSSIQFHNSGDHDASVIALRTAAQLVKLDPL